MLLVDDHLLFAECFCTALAANARVLIADDLQQAGSLLDSSAVDLILLELVLPDGDGAGLFEHLKRMTTPPPVVILSDATDPVEVERFRRLGARGYIHKYCRIEQLLDAIDRVVHKGNECWPDEDDCPGFDDDGTVPQIELAGITARQMEVLRMLNHGYSNQEIAERLGVAESTVKSHVSALLHVFDVKNRNACVRAARRRGLIR